MMNLTPKRCALIILIISLSLGFTSCTGVNSVSDTTWELTKLVSVGDPIENIVTETVEVKNCGIPIEKTIDCSAGTSNDLSVALNSGGVFGVGAQFTIDGNVGTTLGIGQQSGQSVKLANPADGLIYLYTVSKSYQIVAGQAIASSSNGEKQTVDYIFHSSCSIDIVEREQVSCPSTTEAISTETPNWAFILEYRFPAGFWTTGIHQYSLEWFCPNEIPESTTFEFMVSDNYPVLAGDVYLRWSALKKGSPFGDTVEGINPAQSTVASIAWDGMTKSIADTRASTCTGAISWDGGKKEPLMPQIPFQH